MFSFLSNPILSRITNRKTELDTVLERLAELGPYISKSYEQEFAELIQRVCKIAQNKDFRTYLCEYLRRSLNPSQVDWRTLNDGLRILNGLIISGPEELFRETKIGLHCDFLQQVVILTDYSHEDCRVARLIRSAATTVRDRLVTRLECLEDVKEESIVLLPSHESLSLGNPMILVHSETDEEKSTRSFVITTPDIGDSENLIDL